MKTKKEHTPFDMDGTQLVTLVALIRVRALPIQTMKTSSQRHFHACSLMVVAASKLISHAHYHSLNTYAGSCSTMTTVSVSTTHFPMLHLALNSAIKSLILPVFRCAARHLIKMHKFCLA